MKQKTGLALSGGGARGAAHIGAIKVMHQHGIRFHSIAGTSAGALIGAMYAATEDPAWVEDRFRTFLKSGAFHQMGTGRLVSSTDTNSVFSQMARKIKNNLVFAISLRRDSIIKRERLEEAFRYLVPVSTFEELKIPLYVTATNLETMEPRIYSEGDLIEAIVRSSSIPGYVQPTRIDDEIIVDGNPTLPIPVQPLKENVDFCIAVDITRKTANPMKRVNIFEIVMRGSQATYENLVQYMNSEADYVIRPHVKDMQWYSFSHADNLLEMGITAASESIEELLELMQRKSSWNYKAKQWFGHNN